MIFDWGHFYTLTGNVKENKKVSWGPVRYNVCPPLIMMLLLEPAMLETCHERVTARRMRRCAGGVTILAKREEKKVFLNVYTHKKCEIIIL